jgi:hypothetical protein
VEAAYDYFLAEERKPRIGVSADDKAKEGRRPLVPRKAALRAARGGNDDKVQGDVETESPSENSRGAAIDGRRHMPPLDPERHLIVELEPDALDAILDAATTQGGPVTVDLKVTVYPRDAKGFVRVVGEPEPSDLPEDFSPIDDEDGPFHTSPFNEKRVPPPVRPKRLLRKGGPKGHPWMGRPASLVAK